MKFKVGDKVRVVGSHSIGYENPSDHLEWTQHMEREYTGGLFCIVSSTIEEGREVYDLDDTSYGFYAHWLEKM